VKGEGWLSIRWEAKQTNTWGMSPMLLGIRCILSSSHIGWNIWPRKLTKKLNYRFYGPYQIIKVVSHVVYRLDLPSGSKIHPAFSCFSTEESRHTLVANSKPLPNMLSEDLKLNYKWSPKKSKQSALIPLGMLKCWFNVKIYDTLKLLRSLFMP
jgi:hypothetical protein